MSSNNRCKARDPAPYQHPTFVAVVLDVFDYARVCGRDERRSAEMAGYTITVTAPDGRVQTVVFGD